MAGRGFIDWRMWGRDRHHIPTPWPEVLVVTDLRYWDDPIACGHRARPPLRALAETYGWHKDRLHRYAVRQARDKSATSARQAEEEEPTQSHNNETAVRQECDKSATEGVVKPPAKRARKGSQVTSLKSQVSVEQLPDWVPQDAPGDSDDPLPFRLWWWYQKRKSKLLANKGHGLKILAASKAHGPEAVFLVLDWLKRCKVPKSRAVFLVEGGHDNPETLFSGKFETYLGMARKWKDAGSPETKVRGKFAAAEYQQAAGERTPEWEEFQTWTIGQT